VAALKGSTSQLYVEKVLPRRDLCDGRLHEVSTSSSRTKAQAMVADYTSARSPLSVTRRKGLTTVEAPSTFDPSESRCRTGIASGQPGAELHLHPNGPATEEDDERWFKDGSWLKELP